MRVVKVEPGSAKSFAEVEPEIKKGLALDRATAETRKLRDKIDEEIGGGARLDEVAKKLNVPARTIEAIDRSGRGPDGQPVDLPKGVDVLNGIFSAEIGLENDALQTPEGGYVWYDLVGVTPSRERTLDEVKAQVEARWRDDEVVARLNAKAVQMVDKIKGGAKLADLAAADKLKRRERQMAQARRQFRRAGPQCAGGRVPHPAGTRPRPPTARIPPSVSCSW